jgi:hypothetical protein
MAPGELRLAMNPDEIDIELRTVDQEIIEMLEDGRCTRRHLADTLGYTGEYVYQRVTRLMEHGIVEKIHDGFYELATDGGEVVADDAPAPSPPTVAQDTEITLPDTLPNHIDHADARAAIQAAVELVAADGGVQRSEIAATIGETHSLGYDNFGRKGSWWRKVIKPGLEVNGCEYENGPGWSK